MFSIASIHTPRQSKKKPYMLQLEYNSATNLVITIQNRNKASDCFTIESKHSDHPATRGKKLPNPIEASSKHRSRSKPRLSEKPRKQNIPPAKCPCPRFLRSKARGAPDRATHAPPSAPETMELSKNGITHGHLPEAGRQGAHNPGKKSARRKEQKAERTGPSEAEKKQTSNYIRARPRARVLPRSARLPA